ncbi:CMGC kinase [Fusarium heterosporum]|uniref:CMGC kinase n=1 Tax=Fusarium heterosporum TaxID=42747 RepID=A0A8H5T0X7_FUSHE|nr:CMGC kinase [Fusarium heterosporum]
MHANHSSGMMTQIAGEPSPKPRFACPFFKAGIVISAHHRACEGPGWTDINKLKEHIFRTHAPDKYKKKFVCRRCDEGFVTDDLLLAHQNEELPCLSKKPEPTYGKITREQASSLRSLKRKSTKVSDEDRWFEIYQIINIYSNPRLEGVSPYYESNSTSMSPLNSVSSSGISQLKNYLLERDVEKYVAKLASQGVTVSLAAAAKILELQVKEIESFDEVKREAVRAYEISQSARLDKVEVGRDNEHVPCEPSPFSQLLASLEDGEED